MYRPKTIVGLLLLAMALFGQSALAQSGRVRRTTPPPTSNTPPSTNVDPAQPASGPADGSNPTASPSAPPDPVRAAPVVVVYETDANYEAGSLTLKGGEKLNVAIKNGVITFKTKKESFDVPAERVRSMSYGQAVRNRTAEGVGVGTVVPGAGGIISKLKTTKHYIEIVWEGDNGAPDAGAVLRIDKDKYQGLIAALEAATGLQMRMEPAPPSKDFPTY